MLNFHQVHFMHASAPRSGVDTSTTITHSSVYSTLFRGFRTGAMMVPNTLSLDLE